MGKKKSLPVLEALYEVPDFFDFICTTYLNGDKYESLRLFDELRPDDKKALMVELNNCTYNSNPLIKGDNGSWQMELLDNIIHSLKL